MGFEPVGQQKAIQNGPERRAMNFPNVQSPKIDLRIGLLPTIQCLLERAKRGESDFQGLGAVGEVKKSAVQTSPRLAPATPLLAPTLDRLITTE